MSQPALIDYIINLLGLQGMLTYLARNTRPDIENAVHMCARFQSGARTPHFNVANTAKTIVMIPIVFDPDQVA
eukprot:15336669-Ditylum_brightwellii.AAC.1